jgi:Tetracyclin repressor-like, C-terminal domain
VSGDDLTWRIHFMVGGMIHMLTHQEILHRLTNGASGTPSMDAVVSRFIRFSAAGMREGLEPEVPAAKGPQVMFDF